MRVLLAVVIEDTHFQINNPGNENPWTVDSNGDPGTKSVGVVIDYAIS